MLMMPVLLIGSLLVNADVVLAPVTLSVSSLLIALPTLPVKAATEPVDEDVTLNVALERLLSTAVEVPRLSAPAGGNAKLIVPKLSSVRASDAVPRVVMLVGES